MLALRVPDDTIVDQEVHQARLVTAEAALTALGDEAGKEAEALRAELQAECHVAAKSDQGDSLQIFPAKALREKTLAARRDRLLTLRDDGVIGDEAFQRLEQELDFADLALGVPDPRR